MKWSKFTLHYLKQHLYAVVIRTDEGSCWTSVGGVRMNSGAFSQDVFV